MNPSVNKKQILRSLLIEDERINNKIKLLLTNLHGWENAFKTIKSEITFPCSPTKALKFLIFLHYVEMYRPRLLRIEDYLSLLTRIKCKESNAFDKLLAGNAVKGYILYLQRRVHIRIEQQSGDEEQSIHNFYKTLNMMKRGISFSDVFYTFGRYYRERYPFAIDLNIVVGKDIQKNYTRLTDLFNKISSEQTQILATQIDSLHEKMYVVFYNCYFHKYLLNLVPKWIRTQKYHKKKKKINASIILENPETKSTANSYCDKMAQSFVLPKQSMEESSLSISLKMEESRLDLIRDLQKIVDEVEEV